MMRLIVIVSILLTFGLGVYVQEDESDIRQIVLSEDAGIETGLQVYLYDLSALDSEPTVIDIDNDYGGIALNHDGSLLVVPSDCNEVDFLSTANLERVATLIVDHPYCDPIQVMFSHDGASVFVSNTGNLYHTQDLLDEGSNADVEVWLHVNQAEAGLGVFSMDDTLLAYKEADQGIAIVDLETGESISTIGPTSYMINNYRGYRDFVFSTDGQLLAILVARGTTAVFDVATRKMVQEYW